MRAIINEHPEMVWTFHDIWSRDGVSRFALRCVCPVRYSQNSAPGYSHSITMWESYDIYDGILTVGGLMRKATEFERMDWTKFTAHATEAARQRKELEAEIDARYQAYAEL